MLTPERTVGNQRRYTDRDILALKKKPKWMRIEKKVGEIELVNGFKKTRIINTSGHDLGDFDDLMQNMLGSKPVSKTPRGFFQTLAGTQKALVLGSLLVFLAVGSVLVARQVVFPSTPEFFSEESDQFVLAASSSNDSDFVFNLNVPATFFENVTLEKDLTVKGKAVFENLTATGTVTAPNLLYGVVAGDGVSVGAGQKPIISNTGVLSIGGKTGIVSLSAGSGISVSGATVTNSDLGSSQNIFKTITDGTTSFAAGSNTDTLTFAASSGLSLSVDTTNKKVTFSGTSSTTAWTLDSTSLYPSSTTYSVGIGTTSPGKTLDVAGTGAFSSLLTLTGVPSSSGVNTGSLYINPATSTADYTLFGVAVGGVEKLRIDAEGDIHIQGSIISTTPGTVGYWSRTSTNTYLGNGGDLVGIGTSAPAAGIEVVRNGAASQPGGLFSGTWYTGGSSTTTKPQLLVEPTGTTSTGWSTSGTGLGINSASTFAGNLLDLQQAGNSTFKVAGVSSGVNGFTFTTGAASSGVNMSATGSDTNIALTLDSKGTGAVNLGTGASAKTITIGNNTGATALALTSGTGSQTFTSSVATGTTTTSAWVFNDAALTTGTGAYFTSSTLTTGKLVDINTGSANTLTSGTMLNLASVSTGLTTGSLISLDWSPGSVQSTAATGNLFNINIGANASNFAGNLFNVGDAGSSIFSISKSAITSALPLNITAPGDSTFAYDIQMTNPTSSFIKSTASLVLQAGEAPNSSNLTLKTYNQGSVVVDSAVTTGTGVDFTNNTVTTGTGLYIAANAITTGNAANIVSTSTAGGASGASYLLNLARSGANANLAHTAYGIYSAVTNTNATSGTNIAGYFSASGATTANWGVYSAAGNNYFNGNVGIGTTSPGAKLEVGDGTDSLQVSSVGDLTFVDADGAASITGPAGGALTINGGSGQALNLDSGTTGAVNLGTGANAKTITIGNNTGATALAFTSGTGSQTFTSSVVSGTTTTSAWVFNDAALTTGTGAYFTSSTLTTGKLVDISNTSNTQTTGTMFNISSTATSLTTGSLATLDWSPGSVQTTAATGNLFNINIGSNASNFAGNLFNVGDAGSSIFSISKSAVTTSLPMSLTAPGDLSVAYDINMTNPTSSFIKSSSALTLQAGEVYNSADLTLKTYNQGSVVFDSAVTTGTAVDIQNTTLTTGYGLSFTGPTSTGITGSALYAASDIGSAGKLVNLAPDFSGSAVTGYGIYNAGTDATANANTNYGYYGSLALTGNAAKNGYGLYQTVTSSSTTADTLYAANLATSVTGIMTTGTRNVYGLYANPSAGAESTGGTTNVYGGYFKSDADVAADGTVNGYGLYIANGAYDTDGTSTQYGLYVESPTGADTNYAAIFAGGNVGIGTTAPLLRLDVQDSQAATAAAQIYNTSTDVDADGLILKLGNTSTTAVASTNHFLSFETFGIGIVGSVQGNGAAGVSYATSGIADFAEYLEKDRNETIPYGSVVCLAANGNVTQCSSAQNKIVGVASEHPTFIGGENLGEGSIAVGMVGQVQTRVSTANGSILVGDYITASSTPGVAVKATKAGQVIGRALEALPCPQTTDYGLQTAVDSRPLTVDKSCEGKILVLVQPTWHDPSIMFTMDGNISSSYPVIASTSAVIPAQAGIQIPDQVRDDIASLSARLAFLEQTASTTVLGASTSASLSGMTDLLTNNATVSGMLNVTGRTTVADLGVTGNIIAGITTIHGLDGEINTLAGDLKLQSNGLNGIDLMAGKVKIDTSGNIVTQGTISVKKILVDISDSDTATLGSAKVPKGNTVITISTQAVTDKSKIFITPKRPVTIGVTKQSAGTGFTVELEKANSQDVGFDWWIVDAKN